MDVSEKRFSQFSIGDEIAVHLKIIEPAKEKDRKEKKEEKSRERIQIFDGIVIAQRGTGTSKTFTVRKVSYGEGVERIFPFCSPLIRDIKLKKKGKTRRAKLYYLRRKKV
ncbi:MAG: 50S ribosomal protein L19 [bacterium (Candidatus Ratteibacteria) CG_4_10_14_3_um_filter_41_18]|uniref:50S ribosomal protein L19 n=4 Tax=Candidatus Ratteibacteria TaxID=2979319 RepID=A0A2M7YGS0_9BACT|nr:MAG: 50S ribosomal protein L19 [bacterium (Candidatus Ratteibacteria) CG01_land_8_20_14_3_00_40_19]PIW32587.1 MAG: 50S ribosomal protein L19 [bacterium (Candidatus Ratteibacteria) CG15_BIG_FIL_POST_REV_8_21_14_020_41_12]PIX77001.1 MAG: 50S ribosomal protein L19 [bacterium (Candidatus Ratteibacteria) CG_4_10_14_3_um_filter_41_18]PJA62170.1 MAG: 50S ribosomal protein L19 [bacterium (Candidatus Ratteibacteria) CG_4_9_14_3_um_filter_41_21]HCG76660.1 50S ribosomal protein L19 [bacterium]